MSSNPRPRPKAKPRHPVATREKREQTKFDKWLEERKEKGEPILVLLSFHPYLDDFKAVKANVLEVDRYMVRLDFTDLRLEDTPETAWWIPKDSIKAVT
jgi:hypothetical protein